MEMNRRDFLGLVSASAGAISLHSCHAHIPFLKRDHPTLSPSKMMIPFQPLPGPMPWERDFKFNSNRTFFNISRDHAAQQIQAYQTYEVLDELRLPEGFTYDVIAAWGDSVGDGRFGYNNDYLSLILTGEDEGLLTVNFEYVSPIPWLQTYQQIVGKSLPLKTIEQEFKFTNKTEINAFELPAQSALRKAILEISQAGLTDIGIGVISIRRNPDGRWQRTYSDLDRRITGISGWADGRYLQATGPAVAIFRKNGQGYHDQLGDRIIGTFGNCSGGTTPWGTVLSAEENFQHHVPEDVYPDGTAVDPEKTPFSAKLGGLGNVFGLAGNKYGWIVEIDPANPEDYGTKHTGLAIPPRSPALYLAATSGIENPAPLQMSVGMIGGAGSRKLKSITVYKK